MTDSSQRLAGDLNATESRTPMAIHLSAMGLLLVATLVVFSSVREFQFVGYDDPMYIGQDPATKIIEDGISRDGMKWIWSANAVSLWEPLSYLSHMLDVEWFGNGPESGGKHHIGNLTLHVANVLLVYLLGYQLFRQPLIALIAAGLFGLHPMRAESVGWVSERKGVLCAFFMLLAICSYVKYARQRSSAVGSRSGTFWIAASVVATVLAMMSKPAAVVIPLLIGLIDVCPLRRCGFENERWTLRDVVSRQLREKWAFVLAAGALTAVSLCIQYDSARSEKFVGAASFLQRLAMMPTLFVTYVQRSFWPQNLSFEYPVPKHVGAVVFLFGLIVAGLTAFALFSYRRWPGLFFAWGWFLVCLLPVSGLAYVGTSFTTDRYTYFAHIGLFLGVAVLIAQLFNLGTDSKTNHSDASSKTTTNRGPIVATVLGLLLVSGYGWSATRQVAVWESDFTLFGNAYRTQKDVNTGFTNLAVAYERKGEYKKALVILEELRDRRAKEKKPLDYTSYYNLGRLYGQMKDDPQHQSKAVQMYQAAVRAQPKHAPSLHNGARIVLNVAMRRSKDDPQRKPELAMVHDMLIVASEQANHQNPIYLNTLARSCMLQEDWEQAELRINQALALKFDRPELREQLLIKQEEIRQHVLVESRE